jgi:hypothetical protein
LGGAAANALTFNWATTGTGTSGSGTFDILEASVFDGGVYEITNIRGTFDNQAVSYAPPGSAGGQWGNNLFQYQSASTDWLLDNSGVVFSLADGRIIDLWSSQGSTNSQTYATANFVDIYTSGSSPQYNVPVASARASLGSLSAAPGPLPILGIPTVLFFSRKLKKRFKERNSTVVVGKSLPTQVELGI